MKPLSISQVAQVLPSVLRNKAIEQKTHTPSLAFWYSFN